MIKEDLIAERIAVATYPEMEELLAKEEGHADDMAKLLSRVSR